MIQAIAAMGESISGGIIFTLPAIIIWGMDLKLSTIVIVTLLGGLMGLPILPVALVLYLPIHLSAGILIGGIVRVIVEKKFSGNETKIKKQTEKGVLLSSGLVAGDALMGIVIAIFTTLGIDRIWSENHSWHS